MSFGTQRPLLHGSLVSESEPDRFERLFRYCLHWLHIFWNIPVLKSRWQQSALFLLLLALCALRARIGLAGTQLFSHDVFAVLDPAWRMLHGQRPHLDFYSHLGVVTFLPALAGRWFSLGHGGDFGYGLGLGLCGMACSGWAYILGRQRLTHMSAAVLTILTALMVIDPSSLGFSPLLFAPGMTYNRLGYALITILLLEILLPPWQQTVRAAWRGGCSSGLVAGLLLFLKVNYVIAAVLLLLTLQPSQAHRRSRFQGILSGLLLMVLLAGFYFRFHFLAIARDLLLVMRAKHIHFNYYSIDQIMLGAGILLVLAFLASLTLQTPPAKTEGPAVLRAGFLLCIAGALLIFGNFEASGFPLLPIFAVLCISLISATERPSNAVSAYAPTLVLASVCVFTALSSSLFALGNGLVQKYVAAPRSPAIDASLLYGFVPEGEPWYSNQVNDGLMLLRNFRRPGETVMSLDFTNPFSLALEANPPGGGAVALQYGTTFDDRHRPWAGRLFGEADLVMLPKAFSDPSLGGSIYRLYGSYLETHFQAVAASEIWRLYRRVKPPSSSE